MEASKKYRESINDRFLNFLGDVILQPYSIFRHVWKQAILLMGMITFGASIFIYYQALDPLSAIVASVSTISTIGFYAPPLGSMPSLEKVLLILIMIVSVGSAASMVQGVVTSVVKKELWTEDLDEMRIKRMDKHIIVLGYSQIGRYISQRLIEMGYKFCVITRVKENIKELQELGIPFILSDLKSPVDALNNAKINTASAIIMALENDDTNMLFALTAKFMNKSIRTIAINNDRLLIEGMKKAGIDVVLPIYSMVGSVAAYSVISDNILGVIHGGDNALAGRHIVQVEVRDNSKLDGASLKEVQVDVLSIIRDSKMVRFLTPDFKVIRGDKLMCLTDHESLKYLNQMNSTDNDQ
ncbi:MAG: NAD-binding protein [Thaumarchaeota archaeon]|nr:NAD-binding protein [Nitrososphaerota archaeon]